MLHKNEFSYLDEARMPENILSNRPRILQSIIKRHYFSQHDLTPQDEELDTAELLKEELERFGL